MQVFSEEDGQLIIRGKLPPTGIPSIILIISGVAGSFQCLQVNPTHWTEILPACLQIGLVLIGWTVLLLEPFQTCRIDLQEKIIHLAKNRWMLLTGGDCDIPFSEIQKINMNLPGGEVLFALRNGSHRLFSPFLDNQPVQVEELIQVLNEWTQA